MSSIITLSVIVLLLIYNTKRKKAFHLDLFTMVLFFYVLVYFIIPDLLPLSYDCEPFCDGVPLITKFFAIIGIGVLIFGYHFSKFFPVLSIKTQPLVRENTHYNFMVFNLFIAFIGLYLFAQSFGGFTQAIVNGSMMRFTGTESISVSDSAVAKYFAPLAYIVFLTSQYKLYSNALLKNRYMILLVVSTIIIILYGMISASRGAIFQLVTISLFMYFTMKGFKVTPKKIIAISVVIVLGTMFVAYGKKAIAAVSGAFDGQSISETMGSVASKEPKYIYGRFIVEFAHGIKSISTLIDQDIEYNYMKHLVEAPIHLVPTKLLGICSEKPIRISEINSEMLVGDLDAGIPPGLMASFWYGGGILGVISGFFIFGNFIGWFQRQCIVLIKASPSATPIVLYLFFTIGWFINNGDLSVFLKHKFHILVFIFVLFAFIIINKLIKMFFKNYMKKISFQNS